MSTKFSNFLACVVLFCLTRQRDGSHFYSSAYTDCVKDTTVSLHVDVIKPDHEKERHALIKVILFIYLYFVILFRDLSGSSKLLKGIKTELAYMSVALIQFLISE